VRRYCNRCEMVEIVGIVPAAGQATRISPLPCSKELYPIALRRCESGMRPKVVSHYLFERMRQAGIRKAYVILREGKWDIPAYFNDGTALLDIHLAYLMMREPFGTPFTLDQARPYVREAIVALGFPDMIFWPHDIFTHMIARHTQSDADVVLGLVPCDRPHTADMIELEGTGRVRRFVIKQRETSLRYAWVAAVWTPTFTQFMHDYLDEALHSGEATRRELFVGDVIQAAIDHGMHVDSVTFSEGGYVDIGSPEILERIHGGELALP
jgi:glucose-1-phosphate thymidylyltransferase